ncbi:MULTISPECIES: phage tail protein [Escherichia]|uniref:Phage tail protein n=4 Tax=Escherichia coli TaxID=562 RepID=A0ACC5TZG4_ECOLX|nr:MULTISPECIES: phage tail protein [Escherichia]EFN7258840.1 phage tail protein [Escherichia coli O162:H9]ASB77962.1 phage tail protein [Escherichia coli]EFC6978149.1 phage tail protein [Escherichia coli]EFP2235870.1 phage tail protein [Escherichia coli]EFU7714281.1 phage tail protein [Escherichia coli]
MTVKYYAILTNQGAARLANATMLGSKLNLTQMAVGDANGVLPTPDPAQTKLINQKRIAPLNLLSVDPNNQSQIIAEQIIPENEGGFWIREIGLYDDEGVLIAVANCPETYKPQLQEGSGRTQTIRMILVVTNTEAITLKIDPSVVLATRKYVDDEVLELRLYVDDQMRNHIAAQDPHTQYAQKHNPTFTGEPKAPTPAAGNNTTRIATTAFVQAAITALINGAPATLDTLKEIAAAINNDPKFSTTINNALSGKQPLDETLTHLSGKDVAGLLAYLGLGETINKASGAMQKSANGADISDVSAFRNALQLGTAATRDVGADNASKLLDLDSFRSMMSGNGYIYIPCIATTGNPVKLMLQWGTVATQKGADAGYALPFAFPYAGLFATGNRGTSGYNAAMNVRIASRTHISIQNWSPSGEGTEDCCFIALGY